MQNNLYKVIFQKAELRVSTEKMPEGSTKMVNLIAAGFLAACERAEKVRKDEYPDFRIIAVKESVTDVR
jgi:hypothetical protein